MATEMATKRRDYNTGSLYQRKSDWRWVGSVSSGYTATGGRKRHVVTGPGCEGGCGPRCQHRAAIKGKLNKKRAAVETEGQSVMSGSTTVKKWAETWLPIEGRRLRPSSYNATAVAVRRWIVPTIGHRRLSALTPADVRAVQDAQRHQGVSSSTQRRTHSVLRGMLKAALAEGHAIPARVIAVKAPEKAVNDRTDMGVEHAAAVLVKAAELPHGSRWVAALMQALRQGEALGLTWPAVDLENETLTISWQLQPLPYRVKRDRSSGFRIPDGYEARQVKGRLHLVRPKSRAGWRVIPLVPWMIDSLQEWREVAPISEHELVWPLPDGSPRTSKRDDAEWYALQDAAGVRHPTREDPGHYTAHEARHTTATLLLEAKVDPLIITAIMGHSSIVTSRGYMHVDPARSREALTSAMAPITRLLQLG